MAIQWAHQRRSISPIALARPAYTGLALLLCLLPCLITNVGAQTSTTKSGRKVVVEVKPEYPSYLKSIHIEGQVRLDVIVLPSGTVSKVEIRGGNPILAENAVKAVMKWKYAPAATETVEEIRFSFSSH
jgi:TonB family protein